MIERVNVGIAAQFAVDPHQQVLVELRGHAGAVVVGRLQHGWIFLEIDANDQRASLTDRLAYAGKKITRFGRGKVADRRPREEGTTAAGGREPGWQADRLGKILGHGVYAQAGIGCVQIARRPCKLLSGDIDGDEGMRLNQPVEQQPDLGHRA